MIMTRRKLFSIVIFTPLLSILGKRNTIIPVYHPAFIGADYAKKDGDYTVFYCNAWRGTWYCRGRSFQNIPKIQSFDYETNKNAFKNL